jgi:hypothetical protein
MPRLPKNSDRDFSASQSEDDIHADIAELFASQPPEWDDFFAESARADENRNAHNRSNE